MYWYYLRDNIREKAEEIARIRSELKERGLLIIVTLFLFHLPLFPMLAWSILACSHTYSFAFLIIEVMRRVRELLHVLTQFSVRPLITKNYQQLFGLVLHVCVFHEYLLRDSSPFLFNSFHLKLCKGLASLAFGIQLQQYICVPWLFKVYCTSRYDRHIHVHMNFRFFFVAC